VLDVDDPVLGPDDEHHLAQVLRLRPGQEVTVADGQGRWRPCRWTAGGLEAAGSVHCELAPQPALTVAFALTKGDRPEWTVQKLTELGVDRIVVLAGDRSVVRWEGAKVGKQLDRLRLVARQAAMQSRRTRLPEVTGVVRVSEFAAREAGERTGDIPAGRPRVARAEPGAEALTLATPTVAVGPEGGWSEAECAALPATVGLGPGVLRAETAALVAATLLAAWRAGVVGPGSGPAGREGP
jgi:16S rRNA (uracil1498-N3)-methyltransferase